MDQAPKEIKKLLHPRNKHRSRYDFALLVKGTAALREFVIVNPYGDESIDFANPAAVKLLNKALLKHFYSIDYWDIPPHYLCPPIPGRADYIHHIADLLGSDYKGKIPKGKQIRCLDIGVGANCVYPIIGHTEYGWSFVGSDIDPVAIASATQIVKSNIVLNEAIELRIQRNKHHIFDGIIKKDERFDLTICNPPFHASLAEAQAGSIRKLNNLTHKKTVKPTLNFGGQNNELWYEGGEERFVANMIVESKEFANACIWFSTLISKQTHLQSAYKILQKVEAVEVKTIPMGQGNKISRILAWTFLSEGNIK